MVAKKGRIFFFINQREYKKGIFETIHRVGLPHRNNQHRVQRV